MNHSADAVLASPEFILSRVFDAARALVWEAWTTPAMFNQWFGPRGVTSDVKVMDVCKGGMLHSRLVGSGGPEMWALFRYEDVVPQEKLEWLHSFSDPKRGITRHPFSATWPLVLRTTVLLEPVGADQTKVTVRWVPVDANAEETATFAGGMDSMTQGWGGTFDQLADFLKTQG